MGSKIEDISGDLKKFDIQFDEKNMVVCCLLVDGYSNIKARYGENTLDELAKNMTESIAMALENIQKCEVVSLSPEEYAIVLSFDRYSKSEIHDTLEELMTKIRYRLFHYMNMSVSAGVSSVGNDVVALHKFCDEALANAKYRYLLGKGHNIYPEQVKCIVQVEHESIIGYKEPLLKAMARLDKTETLAALEKLLALIGKFKSSQIDQISGYYMELLFIIIHFLHEINEENVNIFEHNTDFLSMMGKFDTKSEIDQWITNLVTNLMEYLITNRQCSQTLQRAKEYIRENYMKKISLADVSEYLGLSEGYFSALFSQENGENFVQYLTNYRIEQAKKLLTKTNLKIYQICDAIGYENVEHYSRVFKKNVGKSPLQYKNK